MSDAAAAVAMPARNADLSMHRFIKALLRLYLSGGGAAATMPARNNVVTCLQHPIF